MLRLGIVGTNFISDWFAEACLQVGGRVHASAVFSRDLDRARGFAARHGLEQWFDDLDEMIRAVDAVYIASPNAVHFEQAMRAVAAGRHVLVEKTMGTSLAQVRGILDAASDQGVVAMEAMRNVHTPEHELIAGALERLGPLRQARIEKLQYSSRYDRFRAGELPNAFDPGLGNSSLADIGVYCLQPALDWFGTPERAVGSSVLLHNGFEGAGSMLLSYDGLVVDLAWSKITSGAGQSVILGEDGALVFDDPAEPRRIEFRPRAGAPEILHDEESSPRQLLHHEIRDFVDQVERGRLDPRWANLSLASRSLMDEYLSGAGGSGVAT